MINEIFYVIDLRKRRDYVINDIMFIIYILCDNVFLFFVIYKNIFSVNIFSVNIVKIKMLKFYSKL